MPNHDDFTGPEFPPLNDVLQAHLNNCPTCQASLEKKPVSNLAGGGKTSLCSEWFAILQCYADYEGAVNYVVAHDEYGNQAKTNE